MNNRGIRIALLAAIVAGRLCAAADLSGNWIAVIAAQREPEYARVSLKDDGGKLTGIWGELKLTGALTGDQVELALTSDSGDSAGSLTGTLSGGAIKGSGSIAARGGARGGGAGIGGGGFAARGGGGAIEFTLSRTPVPPATPREIHFEPTDFFNYYSAANPPVLHIFPGDVVPPATAHVGKADSKGCNSRGEA
jgi:hypothetical protein